MISPTRDEDMPRQGVDELLPIVTAAYAAAGHPERFKVYQPEGNHRFLPEYFEWMTAFLRHEGVRRNSLAESGMRVLRRLEVDHDGLRSDKSRQNYLRIYQAVKYLGWTVHRPPPLSSPVT